VEPARWEVPPAAQRAGKFDSFGVVLLDSQLGELGFAMIYFFEFQLGELQVDSDMQKPYGEQGNLQYSFWKIPVMSCNFKVFVNITKSNHKIMVFITFSFIVEILKWSFNIRTLFCYIFTNKRGIPPKNHYI